MRFGILGDAKIARTMLLPAIRAAGHEIIHIGRRNAGQVADPVWGDVAVSDYEGMLADAAVDVVYNCLLYTSPSPRDKRQSRMPSSA